MKEFAAFVMASRLRAILAVALLGVFALKVPPIGMLSAAVLALVTLRRGWQDGLLVSAAGGLLVTAAWSVIGSLPGLDFPIVFLLWVPVMAAAPVLRTTEDQGDALLFVGVIAALAVIGMHLAVDDVAEFWHEWLKQAVAAVPGATVQGFEENDTLRLLNGLLAVVFTLSAMLSILAGRWMQSLVFNPGGFGAEFRRMKLSRLILPLVIALLIAAGEYSQALLADLVMVSLAVYLFAGLAVAHGVIEAAKLPWYAGIPLYIALVYVPQLAIVALALVGAADAAIDLRALARRRR